MIDKGKHNLLGVQISAVDYEAAVQKIMEAAHHRKPFAVSALAVHGVMTGVLDNVHRHRLNQFELVVPDGQPVRWGLNLLYSTKLTERVYGPNLMLYICEEAAKRGIKIFLFGGSQSLIESLSEKLLSRFPDLVIAGTMASRFRTITPVEKAEVVSTILNSGAAITLVGLGCPRQEVWAYEFKEQLKMPVLAVGAAFNFHAGQLAQAPPLLQRMGLEWLYRLAKEPGRLWRRYLLLNPYYLTLLGLQWMGVKKFDTSTTSAPTEEILYG